MNSSKAFNSTLGMVMIHTFYGLSNVVVLVIIQVIKNKRLLVHDLSLCSGIFVENPFTTNNVHVGITDFPVSSMENFKRVVVRHSDYSFVL